MRSHPSHSEHLGTTKAIVAIAAVIIATLLMMFAARKAHADLIAVYAEGYGGVSSADMNSAGGGSDSSLAVGVQAGARVLGLELMGDYTSLTRSAAIERAILGLRLAFQLTDPTRLELRGGGGVIAEQGGALSGSPVNRAGFVARAGVNLERKLATALFAGIGVNGEYFTLAPGDTAMSAVSTGWQNGMDILGTLHVKFELGF